MAVADASDAAVGVTTAGQDVVQAPGAVEVCFAQGMYISLWPKIERCHNYVSVLLAAQEQLQETVDHLVAGLKEAGKAEASSLVGYADRLKNFPGRVEKLQHKLELIEDRLLTLKEARNRSVSHFSKFEAGGGGSTPQRTASPLF